MTMQDLDAYTITMVSVPQSRDNGLWAALAHQVSTQSAAGPWLVGPGLPDQPVSVGMFAYAGDTPVCA